MKVSKRDSIIIALMSIAIGVLFIIFKGGIIGIAMTVLGVLLIVNGIIHLVADTDKLYGIILICVGALIIIGGWLIATIVLYIIAVLFIIYGVLTIYAFVKAGHASLINLISPILMVVAGILLFLNQKGTVDWVFIVEGIILVIEGAINLVAALVTKNQ